MPLLRTCQCGESFLVPVRFAGKPCRCPACGGRMDPPGITINLAPAPVQRPTRIRGRSLFIVVPFASLTIITGLLGIVISATHAFDFLAHEGHSVEGPFPAALGRA